MTLNYVQPMQDLGNFELNFSFADGETQYVTNGADGDQNTTNVPTGVLNITSTSYTWVALKFQPTFIHFNDEDFSQHCHIEYLTPPGH